MVKSSPEVSPKPRFGPNLDLTVRVPPQGAGAGGVNPAKHNAVKGALQLLVNRYG